jgi:hypothetical protein
MAWSRQESAADVKTMAYAAEGRDFLMHARIGVMRALNRNVERVFDPDRPTSNRARATTGSVLARTT